MLQLKRYKKPVRVGEYVNIYRPEPDVYLGETTESFVSGASYAEWIPNDFSVLQAGDTWHMVGISHPKPKGFVNDFLYDADTLHEAEYQLFHCTAEGARFRETVRPGAFRDRPKLLYPKERAGERPEIWAPHLFRQGDGFGLVYSPGAMRLARSGDLNQWQCGDVLFQCGDPWSRDPFLFWDDTGEILLIFCEGDMLKYRKTKDVVHWSQEYLLQKNPFGAASESPFLLKRDGVYYLMWCLCDGKNGAYDNRSFVFAADTLKEFQGRAPLTILDAHAPEFVTDGADTYLLSVFYPQNGISAAKIQWI